MKKNSDSTFSWFIICAAVSALTFVGLFSGLLLYEKAFLIASIIGVTMFLMMFNSKNMEFLYLSGGLIISLQGLDLPNFNPLGFVGVLLTATAFIIGLIYVHRRKLSARDILIYLFAWLVNIIGFEVMFIDFSSQYIWFPVVGLLFLNLMLLMEKCFRSDDDETIMFCVTAIALAIGIISTIVQFWTSEIILGMNYWLVLLLLGILAGFIFALVKITKKINARRRTEKRRQEIIKADKKRKEKADADAEEKREKQDQLKARISELMGGKFISSVDAIFLIRNVEINILIRQGSLKSYTSQEFINLLPLALQNISVLQEQISWENSLFEILRFIESAVTVSLDDNLIRVAVGRVYLFLQEILKYSGYKGQKDIFFFVEHSCADIMFFMFKISKKAQEGTTIFPKLAEIQKELEKY